MGAPEPRGRDARGASCSASRARAPTPPAITTRGHARRRRLAGQRPEGVDQRRPVLDRGLRHGAHRPRRAEARGHHDDGDRHDAADGVDVRPLREITGETLFNEVFFDDVFVPDDDVVGEVGQRLGGRPGDARQRAGVASAEAERARRSCVASDLVPLATLRRRRTPAIAGALGALLAEDHAMRALNLRAVTRAVAGGASGRGGQRDQAPVRGARASGSPALGDAARRPGRGWPAPNRQVSRQRSVQPLPDHRRRHVRDRPQPDRRTHSRMPRDPIREVTGDEGSMTDDVTRPARRVLHVCYCCADLDASTAFFVDNFGMRNFMGTPAGESDGAILGFDRPIISPTQFVYDARADRARARRSRCRAGSNPHSRARPSTTRRGVGIQALGLAVPDLATATDRLVGSGCEVRGTGVSPFDGASWTTVRDPTGVLLDVVEDPTGAGRRVADAAPARRLHRPRGIAASGTRDSDSRRSATRPSRTPRSSTARSRTPSARVRTPRRFGSGCRTSRSKRCCSSGDRLRRTAAMSPSRTTPGSTGPRSGSTTRAASYAAMSAAGWVFEREPTSILLTGTPVPEMWISFLADPDGVALELVERPRSAFR